LNPTESDASLREFQVKESYEIISIVWIHSEKSFGSVEKLGAFASLVRFKRDEVEVEEMLENDEFTVVDEIVFTKVEDFNG
jgi:hypothetical protein